MANKSYVGDIGTVIEVNMGDDISAADLVELHVKKPDGSLDEWTGTIYNSNYIKYTIIEGDFSVAGVYTINPYLEFAAWQGSGEPVTIYIYTRGSKNE